MITEMNETIKKTALADAHIALGAKMVPFAGFLMPVQYEGINAEHEAVRKAVGVFDVSHMGEFIVKGTKALELLQQLTSNDVSKLTPGKVQYSCMPNVEGGIIDDLLVYMIDDLTYMLVVNASNIQKDFDWIQANLIPDVELKDISEKTSLLAVQGPKATEVLQKLTTVDLASMKYYTFQKGILAGIENVLISATGYTGSGGFELYVDNTDAEKLWNAVFQAGKEEGIKPAGLGARDTLRLEMGFRLYGNDIDDTTSPIESGLGWITKFTKNFTSSERFKAQKENGVERQIVGIELVEKGIPRHHYPVLGTSGQVIGFVTSGTFAPSLQKSIAMAYVSSAYAAEGTEVAVRIRDKAVKAKVVKIPFA